MGSFLGVFLTLYQKNKRCEDALLNLFLRHIYLKKPRTQRSKSAQKNEMKSAKTNEMKSNSWEQFPQESPLRSKDVGRLIACISSIAVATFMVLPQENVEGRLVPVLFKDRPTLYRIFLISALCAFLGSMGSMLIQHKPRVEYFCGIIGVAFMSLRHSSLVCSHPPPLLNVTKKKNPMGMNLFVMLFKFAFIKNLVQLLKAFVVGIFISFSFLNCV